MKTHLFFLALIFTLSSCAPTYKHITISQNQTASITSSLTTLDFLDNDSIPELGSYETTVFIEDLDSLEHYVRIKDEDCYDLRFDSNSFEIKVRDDLPIHPSFYYAIPDELLWEFPEKITNIEGQGKVQLTRDSKKLMIFKSKGNYSSNDDKIDIKVTFGHDSIPSRIKHPYAFKRIGVTMGSIPSLGFSQINGEAKDFMKGVGFMNWGLSIVLNKFRITPRLTIFEGELTKPMDDLQGFVNFNNTNIEFGLGYELLNKTYYNFTPNIFGGGNRLEFYSADETIDSKYLKRGFNYSIGASLELKIAPLFRKKEKREQLNDENFHLQVNGGWYPNYFQKSMEIDGSVNYLTFGLSMYLVGNNTFRKVKLKKY